MYVVAKQRIMADRHYELNAIDDTKRNKTKDFDFMDIIFQNLIESNIVCSIVSISEGDYRKQNYRSILENYYLLDFVSKIDYLKKQKLENNILIEELPIFE